MPLDLPAQTGPLLLAVVTAFAIASIGGRLVANAWTRGRRHRGLAEQQGEPPRHEQAIDEVALNPVSAAAPSNVGSRRFAAARRRVAWATPLVGGLRPLPGSTRLPRSPAGEAHPRRHGLSIDGPSTRVGRQPHTDPNDGD
jgi:hypothetical protein